MQKVFTAIDIDGDGRLSVDEITFMLKRILPGAEITKEQVVSLISVYDANEDVAVPASSVRSFSLGKVGHMPNPMREIGGRCPGRRAKGEERPDSFIGCIEADFCEQLVIS